MFVAAFILIYITCADGFRDGTWGHCFGFPSVLCRCWLDDNL